MTTLPEADATAIRDVLLAWRADGVTDPKIPVYRDVDGDGVPDFYGLGPDDNLRIVSGITVADTVAAAQGA